MGSALICLLLAGAAMSDPCAESAARLAAHPADSDARTQAGWCRYRAGEFTEAARLFDAALAAAPGDVDASVGLGYTRLQLDDVEAARVLFRGVLRIRPADPDARRGLSMAALRAPVEELRLEPDADPGQPLAVPARAIADYLEFRDAGGAYVPILVKGVNLGAALPGRYPTEFPREISTYLGWLDTIAALGANTVRVYTLLPPEFYRALATHNALAGSRRLWLIQGIWAELPDDGDFFDADYIDEVDGEIGRAIDAVHGDLVEPERPGHASGIYDSDASGSLLALIVGREWEPYAVKAFDGAHPDITDWRGTYFSVDGGQAMETWVARLCDFTAGYEAKRYRTIHPLAFANWPTLDPLHHPSESNRDEEDAWKANYGVPFPEALRDAPWENDAVSLDATKIAPTAQMPAGFFAAYHVYPNYPDFLNQETRFGPYLAELKRYHGRQPVLVAEFGISTSRGVAHVHPEGWNHGGHDERAQGEIVASMLRSIEESGCAGGVLFELMDEWFKGTWSAAPLEIPAERRRLWHDVESPEQSYGVLAHRTATPVRVDGDPSDWRIPGPAPRDPARGSRRWSELRDVRATSDEAYLYLLIRTEGGAPGPDWTKISFRLALDTYDPARGATRLPEPGAATIATGAEFLVDLAGPGASYVTVVAPYEPYAAIESGPIASPPSASAEATTFVPLTLESNRERFGRDGTRYPAIRVDRGALRYGSLDPASPDFDTRADVAVGREHGTIEMRLPWALLNVADPSSHRVIHQETVHDPPLDTIATDGIRIYAFAIDPQRPKRAPLSRVPAPGATAPLYTWATWEAPQYRTERKAGFERIRAAFNALPDRAVPRAAPPGGGHAP
jgi:hypothetical protein